MKLCFRATALIAVLSLATVPLLASTKITRRWILTGAPMPRFHKMLVAGIMENYVARQEFEDQVKKLLAIYGVEGVQSYLVLPPQNEMMEGELKQRIRESALDSVLVIRPRAVSNNSDEFVSNGSYVPPQGYYTFWSYWNMAYDPANFPKESVPIRVEFNLFSTSDDRLVWSGETDTIYPRSFDKMRKQYALVLVNRLRKDKIISKKQPRR
jgi:hypothetical protein